MPTYCWKNTYRRKTNSNIIKTTIDFSKTFHRLDREYTLNLLTHVGCPPNIYNMIDQIYRNTKSNILVNSFLTDYITIQHGLKQG